VTAAPRVETRDNPRRLLPAEFNAGDYVVDEQHGIGLFAGVTRRATADAEGDDPVEREYLVLEFAGGDHVYVPMEQAERVHPYIGGEGKTPTLSALGGHSWTRTMAHAREQAAHIAVELARLYASRQATPGHAYGPDTPRQQEMEAAFPHVETPDQSAAIQDVKRDLERPRPMDRLIIGDVGYGKTEVAVRAAFKVVQEGRQVAVLCPTSVLASQHRKTFAERLAPFGVRIEMLSRFLSTAAQHDVLNVIRTGEAQIVIGTHRLLSEDVAFQDLGLVVVDEEQRFGVKHKETLKQLRADVDVLTMSATPIPRTLHLALAGLRDVSLIMDPPEGRSSVETVVTEYSDAVIQEAIRRELERDGQAYFLHNRVETIETVAARLAELVPEARLRVAHGQMDEGTLQETMTAFYERQFDVLVCSTIIEAGVDISNANTLIVDEADQLGLTQLYQIRGRVGRSDRHAYALFLYRNAAVLTAVARQRLAALLEFSELGAGQHIALRDLELRGAGSLLGLEQSGAMANVGLDLYLRMIEDAVHRLRKESR
jgi:transcription-repair coupling factor (superfamily II helicase)